MKWPYRIGLIIAGCYVESAIRNATGVVLYWMGKPDLLQGFIPYTVPVVLGYLFLLNLGRHWSDSRLKNDIMGYTVAVLLVGYPLLVTCSMWISSETADPTTVRIRTVATSLLAAGIVTIVLVARSAVHGGVPLSMPWGTVSGGGDGPEPDAQSGPETGTETEPEPGPDPEPESEPAEAGPGERADTGKEPKGDRPEEPGDRKPSA